ncbi:DUF4870 domain-containing protein [Pseudomethylobacillus aquaticus]|uniref:DUF4870 domain-containing protein n=1 Tax=Pseudomethylobacillus aquaticus TaxID=2676064 RepID=A0A3N0UZM9_9PROT|nr:DUF4870 domain-containing protein [Pseudomethylobacillus aquaticus]ROH85822.1 DUF4870 domain-containing protein [Pseudomethylobacillus aquaticus]
MSEPLSETTIQQPSSDDKNIVVLTHLGGILFCFLPGLIVWLLKKDDNAYIAEQAREALNFQISLLIAYAVCWVLMFILIGFLLMPMLWLVNLLFSILAAVATSKGENYRYPLALRLIS